jgi:hypothetical protein
MRERDQYVRQIDTLIASDELCGADSLCKLLRYLANHTLEFPEEPLKEYKIGTEVLGRSSDFEPQLDSIVRVQAGRLRSRLAKYYETEGVNDPIVVELPKGSYVLSFHHRGKAATNAHGGASPQGIRQERWLSSRKSAIVIVVLSILLAISIAAIARLITTRKSFDNSLARIEQPPPAALEVFWKPFASGPEEPWVVFSNASFVGRPETGLRYYDPTRDSGASIWEHYTGVGEVLAVHSLDQVFRLLHRGLRVKRGSLFTLDEVQNNDLIFVGSPSENLTLMDIPSTKEFIFQRLASGPHKGDLAIVNVHPGHGESKEYIASPTSTPLTWEDYAVVALLPGSNPSRFMMILAGTTTFGTQGAVDYTCRENSVQDLLQRLSVSKTAELKPFEAVLRVTVTRGVPVQMELVALRMRKKTSQ